MGVDCLIFLLSFCSAVHSVSAAIVTIKFIYGCSGILTTYNIYFCIAANCNCKHIWIVQILKKFVFYILNTHRYKSTRYEPGQENWSIFVIYYNKSDSGIVY